jgi:hypothetical protein
MRIITAAKRSFCIEQPFTGADQSSHISSRNLILLGVSEIVENLRRDLASTRQIRHER